MPRGNKPNTPEIFWSRVNIRPPDECWHWTARTNTRGYGCISWNKQEILAHRLAWILTNGDIPNNLFVLHKCDNPPCCNPHHLFLGTNQDNMDDMNAKGRRASLRGEQNPKAKLTVSQVEEIRNLYIPKIFSYGKIAKLFKVSKREIGNIIKGYNWK